MGCLRINEADRFSSCFICDVYIFLGYLHVILLDLKMYTRPSNSTDVRNNGVEIPSESFRSRLVSFYPNPRVIPSVANGPEAH